LKLEPTPKGQREYNDDIHRRLRLALWFAAGLVIFAILLEGSLYFSPSSPGAGPTLVSPDGTVLASAVVVTPELLITNIEPPPGSQLSVIGSDRVPIQKISDQNVRGVTVVLLRLQIPYPKEIPPIRAIDGGEAASALSSSGRWSGVLVGAAEKDSFDPQPSIMIGDLAAVIAVNDHALIAISVPADKGDVLISAQELLAKFPELKK
jgi:hypothetical protein